MLSVSLLYFLQRYLLKKMPYNLTRPIRALVPLEPPWLFEASNFPHLAELAALHGRQRDDYSQYFGMVKEIIATVARRANVGFELVTVPRSLPSQKLNNGTWTGMIGRLQRNEVDIIAENYLATPDLIADGFAFAPPLEIGPLYAVFRRRREGEEGGEGNLLDNATTSSTPATQQIINVWGILKPLSVNAWLVFATCMTFCVLFGSWLEYYEQQLCTTRPPRRFSRKSTIAVKTGQITSIQVQRFEEIPRGQVKQAWSAGNGDAEAAAIQRKKQKSVLAELTAEPEIQAKAAKRASVVDPRYKWKLGNGDRKGWPLAGIMLNYGETMFRILVQRDTSYEPVQSAAAIFLTFWTNFTIIFMSVYAANLFSTYTISPPPTVPFHDFVSLHEAGYRVVVGQHGDYSARIVSEILHQAHGTADGLALEAARVVLQEDSSLTTVQSIFKSIKQKNTRYVALMPLAFANNEQDFECELQALPITYQVFTSNLTTSSLTRSIGALTDGAATLTTELPTVYTSFLLRKNDREMRTLIDVQLWWLRGSGLFSAIKEQQAKLWNSLRRGAKNHMKPCDALKTNAAEVATKAQQLTLRQLASSFILTVTGAFVGFLCYLAENFLIWWEERRH